MKTRHFLSLPAVALLALGTLGPAAGAENKARLGRLFNVESRRSVVVQAGDLIQFVVAQPTPRGKLVSLKHDVQGGACEALAVAETTNPADARILIQRVSLFVKARHKGKAVVRITPVTTQGKKLPVVVFKVTVK
jgi:hypothetical protein